MTATSSNTVPVFSAARIAELIAESPDKVKWPTPEQAEVIEQPLHGCVLVIAGAGSGKTETMANRVVWLVANGLASPSEVLGLTFTRKAAAELGERINLRLRGFSERLALPEVQRSLTAAERERAAKLEELMHEGIDLPEVSTYNAFASGVVQEFGALAGLVPGSAVIDQATAWRIARRIVLESTDDRLSTSEVSLATTVQRVIKIDHAVSDHLTTFDEVIRASQSLDRLATLPYNEKREHGLYAPIETLLENMQSTQLAVSLAKEFAAVKRERGLVEFSDQLALAVETLRRSPTAVHTLRTRTPIVLLDEVQDTSVAQTTLLSMIFAGNSVMAVGDPHQSIYGFRGASASNLRTFHSDFRDPKSPTAAAKTLTLSVSWRNPTVVLDAANAVSEPLTVKLKKEAAGLAVKSLQSRASYLKEDEPEGALALKALVCETIDEEFAALAEWMREARLEFFALNQTLPTAAVVVRTRTHMAALSAALWAAGVPNRIVGFGGLLTTPEVTDLVCLLRCVWRADANSELVRLLAGPRFRLGVSDLRGFAESARWFAERDHEKQRISHDIPSAAQLLPDPDRQFTLLDALDEIAALKSLDHAALRRISEVGKLRLHEAGQMLRGLRYEVGGDLLGLIRSASYALNLDIELDALTHTNYEGAAGARANLEAFSELAEGFLANDETGTLASLLDWIELATEDDEAAEHVPAPEPGTVQLITVHGAKGLEWDLVAIPRLVEGEFPTNAREGAGWLRPAELPDELRGDAAARPRLELSEADTQKEALAAIEVYKQQLRDKHDEEERRLAYVALTRVASKLLLTCSFWGGQTTARRPSPFLRELQAAGLIDELPAASAYETDPSESDGRTLSWPPDPLGTRAASVRAAADLVREKMQHGGDPADIETDASGGTPTTIDHESASSATDTQVASQTAQDPDEQRASDQPLFELAQVLLAEREAEGSGSAAAPAAERLTASTLHEFIEDPEQSERRRLRPMPMRPYRRTRTGNLFHEWVERRASTAVGSSIMLGGLSSASDFDSDSGSNFGSDRDERDDPQLGQAQQHTPEREPKEELSALIDQFEQSRWADLQPLAVELELTIPFAGSTLVCKLDAIYQYGDGEDARYEIVDWKSGVPPKTDDERATRFLQLDLYRQAYAAWSGVPIENIEVTLFYVAAGLELRGQNQHSLEELERLWLAARASLG